MIDSNLRVLVNTSGLEVSLKELKVGQTLIDPLAGVDREIVGVYTRQQYFSECDCQNTHILLPVSIPSRQIKPDGLAHNVLVSKCQVILFTDNFLTSGRPRGVQEVQAQSLIGRSGVKMALGRSEVSYTVILLDNLGFMAISGRLFKSHSVQMTYGESQVAYDNECDATNDGSRHVNINVPCKMRRMRYAY